MDRLKGLQMKAQGRLLTWRGRSGVWGDPSQRAAANRVTLTMPRFTGALRDRTIYEFITDWTHYKKESGYSVNEALKVLKEAVSEPAKGAVKEMTTEAAIFDHLKLHYGDPLLLLNNREREIREWKDCKGTISQVKDWLFHAKARLEATLQLCEDHSIMEQLHYSSVVQTVRRKFDHKMSDQFQAHLVRQIMNGGPLPTGGMVRELIRFITMQIAEATALVSLELTTGAVASRKEALFMEEALDQDSGGVASDTGQHATDAEEDTESEQSSAEECECPGLTCNC
jgi:hypothetical protein